jgi:hypothetical protein
MEVRPFEKHLIICGLCRERFRETDEFVAAMGTAAAEHGEYRYNEQPIAQVFPYHGAFFFRTNQQGSC